MSFNPNNRPVCNCTRLWRKSTKNLGTLVEHYHLRHEERSYVKSRIQWCWGRVFLKMSPKGWTVSSVNQAPQVCIPPVDHIENYQFNHKELSWYVAAQLNNDLALEYANSSAQWKSRREGGWDHTWYQMKTAKSETNRKLSRVMQKTR